MPLVIDISAQHELIDIDDSSQSIFRVFEVSRLIETFENKALSLTRPKLWDDPYENFLKYSQGVDKENDQILYTYDYWSDLLFGQCWTLNEENDAIWRIYSPGSDRVKVRTTVKKLFNFVSTFQEDGFHSYIGLVKYDKQEHIKANISNAIKNSDGMPFNVDSLVREYYLKKRNVFTYENEVRLLVYLPSKPKNYTHSKYQDPNNLDVCNLPLDSPEELFDEIVFDPRMPDSLARAYISYFKNDLKYMKNIHKSNLYEKPHIRERVKSKFGH